MANQSPLVDVVQTDAKLRFSLNGFLLGLTPLTFVIVEPIIVYLEGYQCGNDLINSLLTIALVLWGIELLVGVFGLFNRHLRSFSISLVLSLFLSALVGVLLVFLGLWIMTQGLPLMCGVTS